MEFTDPIPFLEALRKIGEKQLAPTGLSSREIQEKWDADLRAKSLFSARQDQVSVLDNIRARLNELAGGSTNLATARAALQDHYDEIGYVPEAGTQGGLTDHSSDKRINLVLETNLRQVANAAFREQGQTDAALFAFPAWELVRIYPREVPRGERRTAGGGIAADPGNSWEARWQKAGGELVSGRMVARKDDPVWDKLGDSGLFNDGLDQPYPPFAFNSGMGVREVSREDALSLAVIDADTDIEGSATSLATTKANADAVDGDLLDRAIAELSKTAAAVPDRQPTQDDFRLSRKAKERGDLRVVVSVADLEAMRPRDSFYVGPQGDGGIPGRYKQAQQFIAERTKAGQPIDAPSVFLDAEGKVQFEDGRHRFAAVRDAGVPQIAVAMDRESAERYRKAKAAATLRNRLTALHSAIGKGAV
jgi:hypothetical protein